MNESYGLPTAQVLSAVAKGDVATIAINISQESYLSYPVAPASLRWLDNDPRHPEAGGCAFELHQLIERDGPRLVFETYSAPQPLPDVGGEYSFGSWWSHWAMDAARDLSANWQRLRYPNNKDHSHCLFTWESLSFSRYHLEGYHSKHGWITVPAYEEFIEQDRFRIRRQWRSCEVRPADFRRIDE